MVDPLGARLLIVEDDPSVLDLLTTRLELAGYWTTQARDGSAALELISHVRPDGVILDINMPKLDGFGVLSVLRKRPLAKRPPVLMLTARNGLDDVRRCISLGARDYLAKPFTDAVLLRRVARLLRPLPQSLPPAPLNQIIL